MKKSLYITTANCELDGDSIELINDIILLNNGCVLAKEDTTLINIIENKALCSFVQIYKKASHQINTKYADVSLMYQYKEDLTKAIDKAYRYANNEKDNVFKHFNRAVGYFFNTLVYIYNGNCEYNRYKSEFSDGKAVYSYNVATKEASFVLGGYSTPADNFKLYLKG